MIPKERPILFSAPMIRAILDGRKSQTRRAVKPQPELAQLLTASGWSAWHNERGRPLRYPYGQPGDRLWAREAWCGREGHALHGCTGTYFYRADGEHQQGKQVGFTYMLRERRWRPSIYMPRWASRITLEVTGVRVERLQAISEADAIAEGIRLQPFHPDDGWPLSQGFTWREEDGRCALFPSACDAYRDLWESINGPGSWDANPFVWVVEFRRVA
jgi:hypothetical protein